MRLRTGASFPMLSDADLATIRTYGVLDEANDIAIPATFVLDGNGVIRWKYIGADKADRPPVEEVLRQIRAIARNGSS